MSNRQMVTALGMVVGTLCPLGVYAQQQVNRPAVRPAASKPVQVERGQKQFQLLHLGRKLDPVRFAGVYRLPDGRVFMTTPWYEYQPSAGGPDTQWEQIFDCFEADAAGAPTGFCQGGCSGNSGCPTSGASSRWYFGPTYTNPFIVNDMTVRSGFANAQSQRVEFAWNWGPTTPTPCFVAVFTAETFNGCTSGPPGSAGGFSGVVYDFGPQMGGGGYFYADIDLTTAPPPAPFHQMPADGSGAYIIVLAQAYDPVGGTLTINTAPGTQPMFWGTGDGETPPDGRFGTQTAPQWDDDTPVNGQHEPGECFTYNFPVCPNPQGAMILFYAKGQPPSVCYPNCDGSTTVPFLNVADFTCFLSRFAAGDPYANCDGSTTPPVLNVADFTCFLSAFAAGCSAP